EPLQQLRLGRDRRGNGRGAAEPRATLQPRSRASGRVRAAQAALPHADGVHRYPCRAPGAGICHDGGERSGNVSPASADQPVRLRPGHPGGHRTPAVPHRRLPAGRSGGRDPRGSARAGRGADGARGQGPSHQAGARALLAVRSRARDRAARRDADGRRRPAGRRRSAGVLAMSRAALILLLLFAWPATAADWGQIIPGETTEEGVRSRYGAPVKQSVQKVEGYESEQWVYEGAKAPAGITRMTVDFGLLLPTGFKKEVVRTFRLEPKPDIFNRRLVLDGWGLPGRLGKDGNPEFFPYTEGLPGSFEAGGEQAIAMLLTAPQPLPPADATPVPPGMPEPAAPQPAAPQPAAPQR